MHNVTECQQRLIELKYLPALNDKGEPNDDGAFGQKSLDAYNHYRASLGRGPVAHPTMAMLNADLFPDEQPPAPAPTASIVNELEAVFQVINILNALKGTKMDSTKPWYTSQTVWASFLAIVGTALSFFHVGFSAEDQATVLSNIINIATAASTLYAIITRLLASHKLTA